MMSKSGMLRTRRRDVNVKPNRRLDRKSSRGMIYENEELRLRTININAEIERGQSDIKKLRRENEQLRKEIWCLRDEYDKLDKLLKDKDDESGSSCSSDSESCSSCTESGNESTQNLENVQKTTINGLHTDFDHLSVVTEENSAENSDKNSNGAPLDWETIQPDQPYPTLPADHKPKHFFSPIKKPTVAEPFPPNWPKVNYAGYNGAVDLCEKKSTDLLVTDDVQYPQSTSTNSFINGGNLEELLHDIESISKDILQISQTGDGNSSKDPLEQNKPYKSELNVVLLPKPMPLLGFEKYYNMSLENLASSTPNENHDITLPVPPNNFTLIPLIDDQFTPRPLTPIPFGRPDLLKQSNPFAFPVTNSEPENHHGIDNLGFKNDLQVPEDKMEKTNMENEHLETEQKESKDKEDKKGEAKKARVRKVSVYFKGKKEKLARSVSLDTKVGRSDTDEGNKSDKSPTTEKKQFFDEKLKTIEERKLGALTKTSSIESKISVSDAPKVDEKNDNKTSSDSKSDRKHRKSSSTSPERRHLHGKESKKSHRKRNKKRSIDRTRERSFSVCTDRSNILDLRFGHSDEFTNSERERTNSLSSCDTMKSRKLSVPTFQMNGKIPWFACWGNGCL